MPMRRDCYPLEVHLPDGTRARVRIVHVVEVNDRGEATLTQLAQYPPHYERRDGTTVPIDVTIPDDLAATGWYWSGSYLYQPWPERDDGPGVAISTGTFGVEGTFEAARRLDAKRIEVRAMLAAGKTKRAKAGKKTIAIPDVPVVAVPEPELIAEQMELAL